MAIREQNCNYRIKIHGINNLPLKNPQGKYLESKTESDNYIHHQSNIDELTSSSRTPFGGLGEKIIFHRDC